MSNPFAGFLYLLKGFTLLKQPGIRAFVIVPLIINILVFGIAGFFLFDWYGGFVDGLVAGLPDWLQWLSGLFWILIVAASLILVYFTFTIIANFISAPFNGVLAEAVEEHVTGNKINDDSPWHTAITGIGPAIKEEFRKLFYSLTRSLPFLILLFIPGINLLASVLWILFGAWMLVLQYADYPMANHKIEFNDQRKILQQKRFLVLGFGGAVMLGMMIPIVNFFILPSAVVGATLMYLEHFKNHEEQSAQS